DHTLGEIRAEMEQAGTWDETVVIVTSDHWWRASLWKQHYVWTDEDTPFTDDSDHRIPFVLKLANQSRPFDYHNEFNTVLTRELILALLRGDVTTPEDVAEWLDRHRTVGETHYVFETN
ncbi:MAG TPA: hypothetical protein VLD57_08105, partial [Blastocatellia bacterium]|nr:hypothetical protein [Blastocatellia bacterium]